MDRTTAINWALIKLGITTISSEDDQSEPARKARLLFDAVARAELCKNPWSFTIQRVALASNTVSPVFGYQYAYDLPADCLRTVTIGEVYSFNLGMGYSTDDAPFLIERKKVLTDDAGPLYIRYVIDVTETPGEWDPTFGEAFACKLARELCNTLSKVANRKVDMDNEYKTAIREAKRVNAIQQPPQNKTEETWTISRRADGPLG